MRVRRGVFHSLTVWRVSNAVSSCTVLIVRFVLSVLSVSCCKDLRYGEQIRRMAYFTLILTVVLCTVGSSAMQGNHGPTKSRYYCIIGAGPAGLQMGYYLERADRDYVIFEQSNQSGTRFCIPIARVLQEAKDGFR